MPENTEILGIEIRGKENVSDSAKKAEASLKDLLKAAEEARSAIKSIQGSNLAEVGKSAENAKTKVNGLTQAMKAQKKANMEALAAYKREAKESAKAEREQTAARIKQADKEFEVERNLKKNIEAHVASIQSSRDFSNIKMPTYGDSTKKMLSQMKSQINQAKEMATQAEAVRTAPFAVMARNAYSNADLTTLQGMQDFKSKLTSIKGYQDMASARTAVADAMKSGDITSAIKAMNQLEDAEKRTTQATKELDKAQKETSSSAQKMSSSHKGVLGTLSNLFSSLKRIAKLRLLRGIIRGITQSISEGTANLYQYSAAMNSADSSSFSGNMDMMASLLAQLTNAIGTVAGQLMANLAPALSTIANWFITAANAAAQFLAALGGRATYTRAKTQTKAWKEVGGAVGGATAAAKEYKNTIMGFDEINALNDPSSGGGGGGGGGASAPDYSDMFEEVPLETEGIIGALNKLAQALGPVLNDMATAIADWVDGTTTIINGGFTAVQGYFNHNKEQFYAGMDEMQSAFAKYDFFGGIAKSMYDAYGAVLKFFIDVKRAAYDFSIEIAGAFTWLDPLLEKLGLPTISDAVGRLKTLRDETDKEKESVDLTIDAFKRWLDGEITSEQLHDELYRIRLQTGKNTKAVREAERRYREYFGMKPKISGITGALDTVSNATKNGIEKAREIAREWMETSGIKPTFDGTKSGLKSTGTTADTTKKSVDNVKSSVFDLDRQHPRFMGTSNGLSTGIKNPADTAKTAVDNAKNSVSIFDKMKAFFSGITSGFSGLGTSSNNAKTNVGNLSSSVSSVNNMSPSFWGINTGLSDVGWYANDSAIKLWNMKGAIDQINGSTIHVSTSGNIHGGGSLGVFGGGGGSFAKGGFVGNFANGGIIPSFADGGIRTADIFAANENGIPELIGRIGNRTAVANQGQMVDVLADGVFRALAPLFSGGQANTEVNVYMDNEVVARAAERGKQALNRRFNVSLA